MSKEEFSALDNEVLDLTIKKEKKELKKKGNEASKMKKNGEKQVMKGSEMMKEVEERSKILQKVKEMKKKWKGNYHDEE